MHTKCQQPTMYKSAHIHECPCQNCFVLFCFPTGEIVFILPIFITCLLWRNFLFLTLAIFWSKLTLYFFYLSLALQHFFILMKSKVPWRYTTAISLLISNTILTDSKDLVKLCCWSQQLDENTPPLHLTLSSNPSQYRSTLDCVYITFLCSCPFYFQNCSLLCNTVTSWCPLQTSSSFYHLFSPFLKYAFPSRLNNQIQSN